MATAFSLHPLLRQAAPNLSRRFFACRHCPSTTFIRHATTKTSPSRAAFKATRHTPFLDAFRCQSTATASLVENANPVKVLERAKQAATRARNDVTNDVEAVKKGKRFFPTISSTVVGWWLLGSAASVFGIVVLGGLTRLTESGLSITEWKPVTGTLPPITAASWDVEFMKYRRSPEFQKLNPNMNLSEFKRIYWMEYTHRVWGRVVGLSFLLPTLYFVARRRVSLPMARNLVLINCLIATQGFVGWWMVKSGLKDDLFATGSHPRVSQYRLATHLGIAFATYSAMLWNGLMVFREDKLLGRHTEQQPNRGVKLLQRLSSRTLRPFRLGAAFTTGLVAITALSGALVAGLDAGLIYNEFPYMGLGLTPPKAELLSPFYSRQPVDSKQTDLLWRNMLENPSLVQLDHRILATSTFVAVHALFLYSRFSRPVRHNLTSGARRMMAGVLGLVWMQVLLGLTTLLYLVPVPVAAAHQAGSLALLTGCTVLGARVWTPPRLARLVQNRMAKIDAKQIRLREAGLKKLVKTSLEKAEARGAPRPTIGS